MPDKPSLNAAYDLNTPQDSQRLYRDWAATYDQDFAAANGYTYPQEVADIFTQNAPPETAPILDIGAGTGLVGERLRKHGFDTVDALDISAEMLNMAATKGIYRKLHEIDLTAPGSFGLNTYSGLISAGTFTHGHLGPEVLASLVAMGKPGALFVLGINSEHFETSGFSKALADLSTSIQKPTLVERPIYEGAGDAEHANDTALIAVFRKD